MLQKIILTNELNRRHNLHDLYITKVMAQSRFKKNSGYLDCVRGKYIRNFIKPKYSNHTNIRSKNETETQKISESCGKDLEY